MVRVEGGTFFVLLDSPQEPSGHFAPSCRTARCCCGWAVGRRPLWTADSSISRSMLGHLVGPFPSFLCISQWSHMRICKYTDKWFSSLTLFPFEVTPRPMPSVAHVINDTVMYRLWWCSSVSPDRWTEDDKMALLQTSLSLLLLGQAI